MDNPLKHVNDKGETCANTGTSPSGALLMFDGFYVRRHAVSAHPVVGLDPEDETIIFSDHATSEWWANGPSPELVCYECGATLPYLKCESGD